MPYVTQTDLEDRFGPEVILQLGDRQGAGEIDANAVAKAIADADAEVNGYIGARYTLPLTSTPDTVVRLSSIVARWNLAQRNRGTDDPIRTAYLDAVKELQGIANGTVALPQSSGSTSQAAVGNFGYSTPTSVFDTTGLL